MTEQFDSRFREEMRAAFEATTAAPPPGVRALLRSAVSREVPAHRAHPFALATAAALAVVLVGVLAVLSLNRGTPHRALPVHRPSPSPSAVAGPQLDSPAMAWDQADREMVAFGRWQDAGGAYSPRTFLWDGSRWRQANTAGSPANGDVMTADPASGGVLLYGDSTKSGPWRWLHGGWSRLPARSAPPGRSSAAMAADPRRGQVVLFGGSFGPGSAMNYSAPWGDTWVWTGSAWIEQHPVHSPPGLEEAAMAYDPALGGVVLAGGFDKHSSFNLHLWLWTGSDWRDLGGKLDYAESLAPQGSVTLAYDPARSQLVMLGWTAVNGTKSLGPGTWRWAGSSWSPAVPPGADEPPCIGGCAIAYDTAARQLDALGADLGSAGLPLQFWTWSGAWTRRG